MEMFDLVLVDESCRGRVWRFFWSIFRGWTTSASRGG